MSDYIIGPGIIAGSSEPLYSIFREPEGDVVAPRVISKYWAERIVTALTLLDAHERDHKVESYVEGLRRKVGQG